MPGFIGSILGPVVGNLTTEHGEEYADMINELYNKQRNLCRILGEQTHIVKGKFDHLLDTLL